MCARVWAMCALAAAFASVACSSPSHELPRGPGDQTQVPMPKGDAALMPYQHEAGAACTPGETADCVIDRGTFKGIHDCVQGTQACGDDGSWGNCIEL